MYETDDDYCDGPDLERLALIDAWVARAEGHSVTKRHDESGEEAFFVVAEDGERRVQPYTSDDAWGRPILDREGIRFEPYLDFDDGPQVLATLPGLSVAPTLGYSELEAGLSLYVFWKYGDVIETGSSPVLS